MNTAASRRQPTATIRGGLTATVVGAALLAGCGGHQPVEPAPSLAALPSLPLPGQVGSTIPAGMPDHVIATFEAGPDAYALAVSDKGCLLVATVGGSMAAIGVDLPMSDAQTDDDVPERVQSVLGPGPVSSAEGALSDGSTALVYCSAAGTAGLVPQSLEDLKISGAGASLAMGGQTLLVGGPAA